MPDIGDTIDPEQVRQVARLARLDLSADEEALYARQLADVLGHMRQLRDVDTEGVPGKVHAVEVTNVFRDDTIGDSLPHELALRESPQNDGEFFIVPKVFGE
jgi:aspartyl-tRNA(Asn)/glutamyl-tRNA(Gln) amidotransferase subunit C